MGEAEAWVTVGRGAAKRETGGGDAGACGFVTCCAGATFLRTVRRRGAGSGRLTLSSGFRAFTFGFVGTALAAFGGVGDGADLAAAAEDKLIAMADLFVPCATGPDTRERCNGDHSNNMAMIRCTSSDNASGVASGTPLMLCGKPA